MAKAAKPAVDEHDDDLAPVMLPSGGLFHVYNKEVGYFNERVKKYKKDTHFTNIADLATLDQVLMGELLVWRWMSWVTQQKDYWGDPVDEGGLAKTVKETSAELRQLKSSLGIDKITRDRQKGEDSTSAYITNLGIRARQFGVMREEQLGKALELFNDLKAKMTLYDICTEDERKELGITTPELLDWIRGYAIPEYDKVDAHFRANVQKAWIREQ
jgi:hypothetical protein